MDPVLAEFELRLDGIDTSKKRIEVHTHSLSHRCAPLSLLTWFCLCFKDASVMALSHPQLAHEMARAVLRRMARTVQLRGPFGLLVFCADTHAHTHTLF